MENTDKKPESNSKSKKGLSFVSIPTVPLKTTIINKINSIATKHKNETGLEISLIPMTPIPRFSFWIVEAEKRCGFTISRDNSSWGWVYFKDENFWKPSSKMAGTGMDCLVFTPEENLFFTKLLYDNCQKYQFIAEIGKDIIN